MLESFGSLCTVGMLWWRLHLIYTIWKPQLPFPHTGDYSLQSHGCYEPIICAHHRERCPAQRAGLMLAVCCSGGILHRVLRATTECCFMFYASFSWSGTYTHIHTSHSWKNFEYNTLVQYVVTGQGEKKGNCSWTEKMPHQRSCLVFGELFWCPQMFITSTKEKQNYWTTKLLEKCRTDFDKTSRTCWQWSNEQMITFWWCSVYLCSL